MSRLGWAAPQWDHKEGVGTASDGVWLIACELTLNQTVSLTLTLIPTLTLILTLTLTLTLTPALPQATFRSFTLRTT